MPEPLPFTVTLSAFALRHFGEHHQFNGTRITDVDVEEFLEHLKGDDITTTLRDGYAPFCKLLFIENFTDAKAGTAEITPDNEKFLKSGYLTRRDEELPVLARWFEGLEQDKAEYLCLVLYSKEQLKAENEEIEADYGIVAILGQDHDEEEPMSPATMIRNALGIDEGGSGVNLNREAYMKSVEFWNTHALVKPV